MRVAFNIPSVAAFSLYVFTFNGRFVGFDQKRAGGLQE